MTAELQQIAILILPILLGAIIGFLTNAVAIRMLFRPFREVRILGIRLPFTPGIIPRQRERLAESIADMVSQELLTQEAVGRHLRGGAFQARLEAEISKRTDRLRSSTEEGSEPFWVGAAGALLREVLRALGENPRTEEGLRHITGAVLDWGERRTLASLGLPEGVPLRTGASRFGLLLQDPDRSARLAEDLWESLDLGKKTPREILPEGSVDFVAQRMNGLYEPLVDRLVEGMRTPEIRRVLEVYGRRIVRMVINQMNLMQRLLVSAAQYERQIQERMPVIINRLVEELAGAIYSEAVREQLLSAGIRFLNDLADTSFEELARRFHLDIPALLASTVQYGGRRLEEGGAALQRLGERLHLGPETTATELLQVLTARNRQELEDGTVLFLASWVQQQERRRRLEVQLTRMLHRAFEGGAGLVSRLLRLEEPEQKAAGDRRLAELVTETIETFLPRALETFDLRQMVVQRINSLDVREVERLLMQVIARHLKWINVFGALLGGIIGAMQLFLRGL